MHIETNYEMTLSHIIKGASANGDVSVYIRTDTCVSSFIFPQGVGKKLSSHSLVQCLSQSKSVFPSMERSTGLDLFLSAE